MARSLVSDSIRTRIVLLVLAIALPILAMLIWFFILDLRHTRAHADAKVKLLADNTAQILNDYLLERERVLLSLAARPMLRSMDANRCDPIISDYLALNPSYSTLVVLDLNAHPICSVSQYQPKADSLALSQFFSAALRQEVFSASAAIFERGSGRWISALAQPIRNQSGSKIGLLRLALDLQKLSDDVFRSVPNEALVTVTDQDRLILLRSQQASSFIGKPSATSAGLSVDMREGFVSIKGLDGINRRTAFVTLAGLNWRVSAGLPEHELLADFRRTLWRSLAVGIATLGVAIALAWRIGIAIIRPISELATTVNRISNGDRSARTKLAGSSEVAMVGREFNRMLDIFEQQAVALKSGEQNLAITLQSIGDAVIATDAAGQITRMNRTAERLTGWPLTEELGLPLSEVFQIIDAHTRLPGLPPVTRVMHSGATIEMPEDTVLLARDGREYHIADSAAPIRDRSEQIVGVVLVFSDITERHRIAAEKMLSVAQMEQAFDASPIGMALISLDGHFLRVNPELCQMLGWTVADLLHRSIQSIASPADLATDLQFMADMVEGKRPSFQLEKRYLHKDGHEVWAQLNVSLVREINRTPIHFVAQIQNISERKQTQDALQASLAEKVGLLHEVHHRVKNNLQVITSLLRLERARCTEAETQTVLNDIIGRVRAMSLLHESLYRSGIFASVDLRNYLKELCTQAFRALAPKNAVIHLELDLDSVKVSMDQASPCGLLVNELLSNSLKHGFPDGRNGLIRIRLQHLSGSQEILLQVSDNGVGLPADFDIKMNSSLGLQLVSDLTRQIKGRLEIGHSQENRQTALFSISFTADLPNS
ncbi:MAG: PAS domain S-box protein [Burkholderiales bacterium]|nr:PAS domain S-box protein [Burkholderiales bacterium]